MRSARKKLRRGVHTSTRQLEADIRSFIERHNEKPRPYRWIKSADEILSSVKRFCQKTERTLCGELQFQMTSVCDCCILIDRPVYLAVARSSSLQRPAVRQAAAIAGNCRQQGALIQRG